MLTLEMAGYAHSPQSLPSTPPIGTGVLAPASAMAMACLAADLAAAIANSRAQRGSRSCCSRSIDGMTKVLGWKTWKGPWRKSGQALCYGALLRGNDVWVQEKSL